MSWEIIFYESEQGRSPVADFLNGLQIKPRAKCLSYIELLEQHGKTLPANYAKIVRDGVWELRPEFGGTEYRFFYFFYLQDKIYFLHAITKRTQRLKESDIETALRRADEVRRRFAPKPRK